MRAVDDIVILILPGLTVPKGIRPSNACPGVSRARYSRRQKDASGRKGRLKILMCLVRPFQGLHLTLILIPGAVTHGSGDHHR